MFCQRSGFPASSRCTSTAAQGAFGISEGKHETVAWILHDVTAIVDRRSNELLVALQQFHPLTVAECFVALRGAFDVGEHDDDDVSVGRQPRQVGPLDAGPSRQILDRVAYGGTNSPRAQHLRCSPGLSDRERRQPWSPPAGPWLLASSAFESPSGLREPSRRDDEQDCQRMTAATAAPSRIDRTSCVTARW